MTLMADIVDQSAKFGNPASAVRFVEMCKMFGIDLEAYSTKTASAVMVAPAEAVKIVERAGHLATTWHRHNDTIVSIPTGD